jgi:hypothetical protein
MTFVVVFAEGHMAAKVVGYQQAREVARSLSESTSDRYGVLTRTGTEWFSNGTSEGGVVQP